MYECMDMDKMMDLTCRPEFLNRLDEIILFKPLHRMWDTGTFVEKTGVPTKKEEA